MTEQAKLIENTFSKEKNRLFNFIRKFVPSKEDAEDILQDVFYQFISRSNFEIIDKISAWLFRTAKNRIIDSGRKKKPDSFSETFSLLTNDDGEPISVEDFLPAIEITPEDLFLSDEFNENFVKVLEELPEEQREVFVLNEIEELSFKEISELTGVSVNTLLSRKHYAVMQLKKKLNKYLNG
jgi:RNA polymerase sigma factor (sigma-70 family)